MTMDDVRAVLRLIRDVSGDPEAAHGEEDDLWRRVLESIANGTCKDPSGIAAVALESSDISFPRWYA